jgi:hypothetical protein
MVANLHVIPPFSQSERDVCRISKNLTGRVKSMDFKVQDCGVSRGTGKCQYRGVCRVPIIIYKITCKMMIKICIGKTHKTSRKEWQATFRMSRNAWRSPLQLLCQTFYGHLAKRSCSTIARNAAGPHRMQHSMARQPNRKSKPLASPPALCATEKEWKSSNFPKRSPINLSTLAPKSTEHANTTNQGSIGITNRRKPPLPSADERKKSEKVILKAPNPLTRRINSTNTDGNESV